MDKILNQKDRKAFDEDSTQMPSLGSVSLPQAGVRDQPTMISSSCSSSESSTVISAQSSAWSGSVSTSSSSSSTTSSTLFSVSQEGSASLISMESSSTLCSATQSYDDDTDEYAERNSKVSSRFSEEVDQELDHEPQKAGTSEPIVAKNSMDSEKSSLTKLSLELDDVMRLVRLGRSAGIRNRCQLPPKTVESEIHVRVDIDQKLDCGKFGEIISSAIQNDLSAIYTADSQSAKFVLCVVIVAMTDGSLFRSLSAKDGVMGLAELGVVWRLFEADDLTLYDGGLVVKSHDVVRWTTKIIDLSDPLGIRGRQFLLNKLAPAVANDIMSRIEDTNDSLLCEI